MKRRIILSLLLPFAIIACEGEMGPQGPAGNVGPAGPTGPAGSTGAAGQQGAQGSQGPQGDMGDKGDQGDQGLEGPQGQTIVLSANEQAGLDASPVPIDLSGLTGDEIQMVANGSYLVNAMSACNDCHAMQQPNGPPQFLGGGTPFDLGFGRVFARNLTPDANTGMTLTEDEFVEAMRTGKDFKNNNQLLVMPWFNVRWLTEHDIRSIYHYLKRIPAVVNQVPDDIKGPATGLAPMAFGGTYNEGAVERDLPTEDVPDPNNVLRGLAIQPLDSPNLANMDAQTLADYGRGSYIVNTVGFCNDCHTNPMRNLDPMSPNYGDINVDAYLSGGGVFPVPPGLNALLGETRNMSENLTGQNFGYTDSFALFFESLVLGVHADEVGRRALGWPMPFSFFRNMTIDDLVAVYTYITNVPRRTGINDKLTQPTARYCAADMDCAFGETCNVATNECVGGNCTNSVQCGACQECTANVCTAPTSTTTGCAVTGI